HNEKGRALQLSFGQEDLTKRICGGIQNHASDVDSYEQHLGNQAEYEWVEYVKPNPSHIWCNRRTVNAIETSYLSFLSLFHATHASKLIEHKREVSTEKEHQKKIIKKGFFSYIEDINNSGLMTTRADDEKVSRLQNLLKDNECQSLGKKIRKLMCYLSASHVEWKSREGEKVLKNLNDLAQNFWDLVGLIRIASNMNKPPRAQEMYEVLEKNYYSVISKHKIYNKSINEMRKSEQGGNAGKRFVAGVTSFFKNEQS
ncbi:unnamed protein product, partial [marine sediment metagenome]